ncbi:hypothetical protein HOI83_03910 [Candidatus Uhrbacteria bacterium]|jgi:hypothetical protein|nr:hypothetical protein [Candidatus Uhrbacteria bacterium]
MLQLVVDFSTIQRFLALPADEMFFRIMITVGWIPIAWVLIWGASMIFLGTRQGKFSAKMKKITLAIDVPVMSEQSPKAVENIFAIIKGTKSVITFKEKWLYGKFLKTTSFEIVSIDGYIQFFMRLDPFYRDLIESAIYSQYPDAEIAEVDDYMTHLPDDFPNDTHELFGGEITLGEGQYLPIKTYEDFEHMASKDQKLKDPLIQLFELMSRFGHGEQFYMHIMLYPDGDLGAVQGGEDFIMKTFGKEPPKKKTRLQKAMGPIAWIPGEVSTQVGSLLGGAEAAEAPKDAFKIFNMTNQEKGQLDAVAKKLAKPGYPVKIRWGYVARHDVYNKGGRNSLWKGYIALYANQVGNRFKYDPATMPRDDYFWLIWEYRRKQRELMSALKGRSFAQGSSPMYLNLEELATLWHFPTIDIKAPLIKKSEAKRGEAPTYLPTASFGENDELSDSPLIEVDEQGRPIERKADPDIESHVSMTPDELATIAPDELQDILPEGPLVEADASNSVEPEETKQKDSEDDDRPFVPPNLPV